MRSAIIALSLLLLSSTTFANGSSHAKPIVATPSAQSFSKANYNSQAIRFTMKPGSLRKNITALAKQHGWKNVIWKPSHDFSWKGRTTIKASTLLAAMNDVLNDYPLQARFYHGNHILVIVTRNLK